MGLPEGTPCGTPDGEDFDTCNEGFGLCQTLPPGSSLGSGFGFSGTCIATPKPEGTACDDNNDCTVDDKCSIVAQVDGELRGECTGTFAGDVPCFSAGAQYICTGSAR